MSSDETTTVGDRYDETSGLDLAGVAKLIRADINAALTAGTLTLPAGAKLSVRIDRASMYQAIQVKLTGASAEWAFDADYHNGRRGQSLACWELGNALYALMARYNREVSSVWSGTRRSRFWAYAKCDDRLIGS